MKKYKLSKKGVFRDDGAFIPEDLRNRDYRQYQEWLKEGNDPDPEDQEVKDNTPEGKLKSADASAVVKAITKALSKKGIQLNVKDISDEI